MLIADGRVAALKWRRRVGPKRCKLYFKETGGDTIWPEFLYRDVPVWPIEIAELLASVQRWTPSARISHESSRLAALKKGQPNVDRPVEWR